MIEVGERTVIRLIMTAPKPIVLALSLDTTGRGEKSGRKLQNPRDQTRHTEIGVAKVLPQQKNLKMKKLKSNTNSKNSTNQNLKILKPVPPEKV